MIGPTRQVHERPGVLAEMDAGTGTIQSSRAAPHLPASISGEPSPHAPRTCGAHSGQREGRATSAHTVSTGASESAEKDWGTGEEYPVSAPADGAEAVGREQRVN